MFFLSPLLWLSRLKRPDLANMDQKQVLALAERTRRVPAASVNALWKLVFNLETPLGLCRFRGARLSWEFFKNRPDACLSTP